MYLYSPRTLNNLSVRATKDLPTFESKTQSGSVLISLVTLALFFHCTGYCSRLSFCQIKNNNIDKSTQEVSFAVGGDIIT